MTLKSAWAYNNGQRIMNEALTSLKDEKTGWVEIRGSLKYAERPKGGNKLSVKTYSNKTQAENKLKAINDPETWISMNWPFTINKSK